MEPEKVFRVLYLLEEEFRISRGEAAMYHKKPLAFLTLALVLSIILAPNLSLAEGPPPTGTKSTDPHRGEVTHTAVVGCVGVQGTMLISQWGAAIERVGARELLLTGYTQAYQTTRSVSVTVYVQRWNGSAWVDLPGSWPYSKQYASYVAGYPAVKLNGPGYYRTRAVHDADDGLLIDRKGSLSPYIWVD
jgi:hypothetical protein